MLSQDLRHAWRALRHSRGMSLLAVASVALAIAGNTAVFSTLNGLFFRPLPFPEAERLGILVERSRQLPRRQTIGATSDANFLGWRERQGSFLDLAAFQPLILTFLPRSGDPLAISGAAVTPSFFPILGSEPLLGRIFTPEEGRGGGRTTILSHDFWVRQCGARPDIVGDQLDIDGELHEVVGVLPASFQFIVPSLGLLVPLVLDPAAADRHHRRLYGLARLEPGIDHQAAQAEMDAIMEELTAEHPEANRGYAVDVLNLQHDFPVYRELQLVYVAQAAFLFILLIACANVATLLLARNQARRREMALRFGLGASPWRIARQLLSESLTLALASGVLGLLLAAVGIRGMRGIVIAMLPRAYAPVIDGRVLLFSLAVTLGVGLVFGLVPLVETLRSDLAAPLRGGMLGQEGGRRILTGRLLAVGEIALALVFLGGAGVMGRSLERHLDTDPGFATDDLLAVRFRLPAQRYRDRGEITAAVEQLKERLAAVPGTTAVAVSHVIARSYFTYRAPFAVEGFEAGEGRSPQALWLGVGADFFATLGIPLVSGRAFTDDDRAGAPAVVVINRALARRLGKLWPESPGAGDPRPDERAQVLGHRLTILGRAREIVGVSETVHHGLSADEAGPAIYLPWTQTESSHICLTLRTAVEPGSILEAVRQVFRRFDAGLAFALSSYDDAFHQTAQVPRLYSWMIAGYGLLALILAALGIYGVLTSWVIRRRHEIGVRMALGAGRRQMVWMLLRQGAALAAAGVVVAIPGTVVLSRLLAPWIDYRISVEPWAFTGVALALVAVTLAAGLVPAWRAARGEPIESLRRQ